MDIRAALTVVGDGPVGAVGKQIDQHFGMPPSHGNREWAVGMKMVVDLDKDVAPGTVIHTFGFPEPEIFGFLYIHPDRVATAGIFIPSWFRSPARTSYRYLQHFIQHPYLGKYLEGAKLRSWGAKSLQESGRRGEPYLAGNGYARIGEGSGSTNVLTGSGVDEAWTTGTQLADAVIDLLRAGKTFTRENLEQTYVAQRRASWIEEEAKTAECARDGFHNGLLRGMFGMALAGFTHGKLAMTGEPHKALSFEEYYRGRLSAEDVREVVKACRTKGVATHDALMDLAGWPPIQFDGKLLVTQQDALLMGGKVQAPAGTPDHVRFADPEVCRQCGHKLCVEICSGQAIGPAVEGVPTFDREKCVHCGACQWNCEEGNLIFQAGPGGLHSSEN
jgi:electron-transferring-flavoprotein dehydrogenase